MTARLSERQRREILKELYERQSRAEQGAEDERPTDRELQVADRLERECFEQQRAFFFPELGTKPKRRRVARGTRRMGKTEGAARKILVTLLRRPRSRSLYVAKTAKVCRLTVWPELRRLISLHDLPIDPNKTEMSLTHKRAGGFSVLHGSNDQAQIEKLRGLKLVLAILDESGSFGAEFERLVVSVISPGLRDQGGELLLIGTPGYFPEGLFYEASEGLRRNWQRHEWTLQDNVYLSEEARDYDVICEEEGLTRDDPAFIREWLGKYCVNRKTQMFAFDPAKDSYEGAPPPDLVWYLGLDFGWTDASAIVAVGWSSSARRMWVDESWAASEQTSDNIADKLHEFIARYKPVRLLGDLGGYGKGVAGAIFKDYGIYIETANKQEKLSYVEFMNSAFLRGDLKVRRGIGVASELPKVLWNEAKTDAHKHAKDDQSMALLYAWRAAADLAGKARRAARDEVAALVEEGWPEEETRVKLGVDQQDKAWWERW